jgi:hypothetical protein
MVGATVAAKYRESVPANVRKHMDTLIVVLAVVAGGIAIMTGIAFYRGWFRLASVPTNSKGQFVLMRKSDAINQPVKNDPGNAEPPRSVTGASEENDKQLKG